MFASYYYYIAIIIAIGFLKGIIAAVAAAFIAAVLIANWIEQQTNGCSIYSKAPHSIYILICAIAVLIWRIWA
jgi:hypothetical protein